MHNMATECYPHYNRYTLLSRSSMNCCYSVNFSPEIVLRVSGNRFQQLSDSSTNIRHILYSISFIWASSWFSRLQRRHQCLCPTSWQWIQSRVHLNWLLQIIIDSAFTSPNHCCQQDSLPCDLEVHSLYSFNRSSRQAIGPWRRAK